jgi:hypothetical protein
VREIKVLCNALDIHHILSSYIQMYKFLVWVWWLTLVIPAIWEAEIKRIVV